MIIQLPSETYPPRKITELLAKAEAQGFSLEKGSPLEHLTIPQLEELVNGKFNA